MDQYRCPTGRQGRIVAAKMNQEHRALTSWGLKHVKIASDAAILDVGCGGGKTLSRLARRATHGKVFGIDYSPDMVHYAKEVNKKFLFQNRVEIVEAKVEEMAFPDNSFDLVTAFETYYFWSNLLDAFQEIRRVLKPEGKLLIVNEMVKDGVYEVEHAKLIEETHVRLLPVEEIKGVLESVDFVDVKVFIKRRSPWNAILAQKPGAIDNLTTFSA
jgi:ubiquinone/menaquinone biosynthesis C-methylase UbiE